MSKLSYSDVESWLVEHNRRLGGDMSFEESQISREAFEAGLSVTYHVIPEPEASILAILRKWVTDPPGYEDELRDAVEAWVGSSEVLDSHG